VLPLFGLSFRRCVLKDDFDCEWNLPRRRCRYDQRAAELLKTLAEHHDVDALLCFTDEAGAAAAKALSVGNLEQVFTDEGRAIVWFDVKQGEGRWFLDHAVQVKNISVPYGE
jgi:aldehyde dehydrogenase (NAD+)